VVWYKIGNTYINSEERAAAGYELYQVLLDVVLPGAITYYGVTYLAIWLEHFHFFIVHTTISKLIYMMVGFFIFCVAYFSRILIVGLAVLTVGGGIALLAIFSFCGWLFG
jgi:hypothetical protein